MKTSLNFSSIAGFLLDMDGTFFISDQLLPGARAFFDYAIENALPFLFLTNNSSKNRFAYVEKMSKFGIAVPPEKILTSGEATARYLQTQAAACRVAVFGTPELEQDFADMGFTLDMDQPDYVVLGFDTTLDYAKLTRLCDLVRAGLPYWATHPDFNCPVASGFIPDIGAMMALVEASTGRKADLVVGKPNRIIAEMAAMRLNLPLAQLCMVGDRLYTDVAMGKDIPIQTALVLSGESKLEDIANSPYQPDYVFANLAELLEHYTP